MKTGKTLQDILSWVMKFTNENRLEYIGLLQKEETTEMKKSSEMRDVGSFHLDVDENGGKFWRGSGSSDDKDETIFDPGEMLRLHPDSWLVGSVIKAYEPVK